MLALPSGVSNGVAADSQAVEFGNQLALEIRFADDGQELARMKFRGYQKSPARRTAM
ncbi:MAG: hypothetical protein HT580_03265 [Dechloromonas sp.]|nr:MAG: hypothetical protein HT580_03265 [Dechloromonas sp.]